MTRLEAARAVAGVCTRCTEVLPTDRAGRKLCAGCRLWLSEYNKARYAALTTRARESGGLVCNRCGEPNDTPRWKRCSVCRLKIRLVQTDIDARFKAKMEAM